MKKILFTFLTLIVCTAPLFPQMNADEDNGPRSRTSFMGGASLPTGALAATTGNQAGFAKMGFALGLEYIGFLNKPTLISFGVLYASNPMDESAVRSAAGVPSYVSMDLGSYTTITPMVGVGFWSQTQSGVLVFASAHAGLMIGSTPSIKMSYNGQSSSTASASSTAAAFGFQMGVSFSEKITVGARYLTGTPKYKVTVSGSGGSSSGEFEQPTGLIQILAMFSM